MSEYGSEFDRLARVWADLEQQHDRIHPDRSDCRGVGACSMMLVAHKLTEDMGDELEAWRHGGAR